MGRKLAASQVLSSSSVSVVMPASRNGFKVRSTELVAQEDPRQPFAEEKAVEEIYQLKRNRRYFFWSCKEIPTLHISKLAKINEIIGLRDLHLMIVKMRN